MCAVSIILGVKCVRLDTRRAQYEDIELNYRQNVMIGLSKMTPLLLFVYINRRAFVALN